MWFWITSNWWRKMYIFKNLSPTSSQKYVIRAVTNPIPPVNVPGVEYLASLFFLTSFCIICCWNWSFEGLSNSVLAQFSRRFLFRLKIASYFFHNSIYPIEYNTFRRQKWLFLFDLEVYTLRMRFFSFCFHLLNYSIRGGTHGRLGRTRTNLWAWKNECMFVS